MQGITQHVSIPNRDFDELQSNKVEGVTWQGFVSIPNRDFDELQSRFSGHTSPAPAQFQSLIGILMNCNFGD